MEFKKKRVPFLKTRKDYVCSPAGETPNLWTIGQTKKFYNPFFCPPGCKTPPGGPRIAHGVPIKKKSPSPPASFFFLVLKIRRGASKEKKINYLNSNGFWGKKKKNRNPPYPLPKPPCNLKKTNRQKSKEHSP